MAQLTVTEALAEIRTIDKRIEKKREVVKSHLARNEMLRDPFERDGGSPAVLAQELQGIRDLEQRKVLIRVAIQDANRRIPITVRDHTKTIAEWLLWRREVAPKRQEFLKTLSQGLAQLRREAQSKGATIGMAQAAAAVQVGGQQVQNILVNISEIELTREIEELEVLLGDLDGLLSLKNATESIVI